MNKIDLDRLTDFCNLAYQRHFIYTKKEVYRQDKPWTEDPIFLKYRFCNVFRHLDKVTKYIINNVIKPNENNPNLWKGIIISRFFSKIETIEELLINKVLFGEDNKKAVELLKELSKKQPLMTSAFILNPLTYKGKVYPKLYTPFLLCRLLTEGGEYNRQVNENMTFDKLLQEAKTLKEVFNVLTTLPSTAGFMAYEYVTDFTYSRRYFYKPALDKYTWGNFTIGSLRGLKRLCNLSVDSPVKLPVKEMVVDVLTEWRMRIDHSFIDNNPEFKEFSDLSMREVEHWLCEYDKYERVKNGEAKRLKRNYDGGNK